MSPTRSPGWSDQLQHAAAKLLTAVQPLCVVCVCTAVHRPSHTALFLHRQTTGGERQFLTEGQLTVHDDSYITEFFNPSNHRPAPPPPPRPSSNATL